MGKLTKKQINEATKTTEVLSINLGRLFNHRCQLGQYKGYATFYNDPKVYFNYGPNTKDTGLSANNKKEFIQAVYDLENI